MVKISNILDDWFLNEHEVNALKFGKKTIMILPNGYKLRTDKIIFANGMAFKIERRVIRSIKNIIEKHDYKFVEKFGVKQYHIPASCDHPDFYVYSYVKYEKDYKISYKRQMEAFKAHLIEFEKYTYEDELEFLEVKVIFSDQYFNRQKRR